jgi:hypothetical protein
MSQLCGTESPIKRCFRDTGAADPGRRGGCAGVSYGWRLSPEHGLLASPDRGRLIKGPSTVADIRLFSLTLAALTFSSRAVSRPA